MENRYGYFRQGSGVWRSLTEGDFEEEDVWALLKERREDSSTTSSKVTQFMCSEFEHSISVQRRLPSAARMIPKTTGNGGYTSGSSNSNSNSPAGVTKLQSAPVKIPDWSNFNGLHHHQSKKPSKNVHDADDEDDEEDEDDDEDDDDDDDDDGYNSRVPPHEFIARRQARSPISSFSVFEGVGRTLKGRDLSKVRNAVLTRTGFLEK